jgi:penicillin-binding protein 1C
MRRAGAAALGLAALLALLRATRPVPLSFEQTRARHRSSEAVLLDRQGRPLQELRADSRKRALDWTPLAETSAALQDAVLAAEDRRFYLHHGVDARALAGAILDNARGRRRGASTITMQLAAQLNPALRGGRRGRTLPQKWGQLRYALALERGWTKAQILEAYLNLAASRGEVRGVAALSRGLFGKAPHGLDVRESALLAALLREPGASPAKAAARAAALARRQGAVLDEASLRSLALAALTRAPAFSPSADAAPEAARRLLPAAGKAGDGPLEVRSSLDGPLQRFAAQVLRERVAGLSSENVKDGAALVVDNDTGEVLAYVGNVGRASSARFVDGVQARRQAGSTLKPFLYSLAFERRLITPASLLDDSPLELLTGRGLFRPENYDHRFLGPVTARAALASSINVPAVRLLELVGEDAFVSRLSALGFASLRDSPFYGPSLALGTADVTLWELVAAYRALAEGGRAGPLTLRPAPAPAGPRVVSKEAAFIVGDILSDRESRSGTFGLDSPLSTRFWTAVKTGTSKDMRDNWCVGFSRRYTVGVWVGNFSGASMWNVSGVSGAAPAWLEIMNYLHAVEPSAPPPAPSGVARRGTEWFLRGTEPSSLTVAAGERARLLSPVSGTIIALDPDIPAGQQSVPLVAAAGEGLRFSLNGADVGAADAPLDWSPEPGRYTLALLDRGGRKVDAASFEVRGALAAETGAPEAFSPDEDEPAADLVPEPHGRPPRLKARRARRASHPRPCRRRRSRSLRPGRPNARAGPRRLGAHRRSRGGPRRARGPDLRPLVAGQARLEDRRRRHRRRLPRRARRAHLEHLRPAADDRGQGALGAAADHPHRHARRPRGRRARRHRARRRRLRLHRPLITK